MSQEPRPRPKRRLSRARRSVQPAPPVPPAPEEEPDHPDEGFAVQPLRSSRPARARRGPDTEAAPGTDPWSGISALFGDRAAKEESPEGEAPDGADALALQWERPDVFVEGTPEDVTRRLDDLARNVTAVDRRLRDITPTLRVISEEGIRGPSNLLLDRLQALEDRVDLLVRSQAESAQGAVDSLSDLQRGINELAANVRTGADRGEAAGDEEPGAMINLGRLDLLERNVDEMRIQQERTAIQVARISESVEAGVADLRPLIEHAMETAGSLEVLDRLDAIQQTIEVVGSSTNLEEPLQDIADRLTATETRLTELVEETDRVAEVSEARASESEAGFKLADQINEALSRDPFDLVSTQDVEAVTAEVANRVKRLGVRVERLEAILDRGLSGIEESRRAAVTAAQEMTRVAKLVEKERKRAEKAIEKAAAQAAAKRAAKAAPTPAARATAKRTPTAASRATAKRTPTAASRRTPKAQPRRSTRR